MARKGIYVPNKGLRALKYLEKVDSFLRLLGNGKAPAFEVAVGGQAGAGTCFRVPMTLQLP